MKKSFYHSRRVQAARTTSAQRAELLTAYHRSGLSAAAFARQQGLHYTTFCGWRAKSTRPSPGFVQVEPTAPVSAALVVELGGGARLQLHEASQLELAVQLLAKLQRASC
jgi:hypothetical protein